MVQLSRPKVLQGATGLDQRRGGGGQVREARGEGQGLDDSLQRQAQHVLAIQD